MRVFISWSGERSHAVAIALKNFVGDIIQNVTAFVSDEDIVNGERWTNRLQEELQVNQYGILSITLDNKEAPWLLFEAGALSNSVNHTPVVPFLYDVEPSDLTGSPLLQFQATIFYSKENVRRLVYDINAACGDSRLDDTRLERAFDRLYPEFEKALKQILPHTDAVTDNKPDKNRAILEEILDLTRRNRRALGNWVANCKLAYEFTINIQLNGITAHSFNVLVNVGDTFNTVLDTIYFCMQDYEEGIVTAYTYLHDWVLCENDNKLLIISGLKDKIPAEVLFQPDSVWTVKLLSTPILDKSAYNLRG
ncbi:hypothetical protein FACS1894120_4630 [Clostridia bacterium]|nr:hypothetical protein FACS1894120_4630 [Clostridia bacterium]